MNGGTVASRLALRPELQVGAIIALAVVAGLVIWLLTRGNDNSTPSVGTSAHAASARQLARLPSDVGHPVYWAGPKPGFTYELTQTSEGRIYIRYLPAGVQVGSNQPKYLTVGTYPVKNATAAVRRIASRLHVNPIRVKSGGLVVQDAKHATSVYLAYAGSDYEIEVYDPSPARGLQLALSGAIIPIGSATRPSHGSGRPRAATVQQLRALESSLGQPVYWVGPEAGITYEVTETTDGRLYVRYLPRGAKVGVGVPHTTVGTYPLRNAVAAVRAIAKANGVRAFSIGRGGIAAVDAHHPTSVYVAFAKSNFEIEVFDPSPARARRLVRSGLVVPVR
jgi:hypothetical protein